MPFRERQEDASCRSAFWSSDWPLSHSSWGSCSAGNTSPSFQALEKAPLQPQYSSQRRSTNRTISGSITSGFWYPGFQVASIPITPR